MTKRAAQSVSPRAVLTADRDSKPPRPARMGSLVYGLAAQDALVAIFDDLTTEESPELRKTDELIAR